MHQNVLPGKYIFETWLGGERPEKMIFVLEPKEAKRFDLKLLD